MKKKIAKVFIELLNSMKYEDISVSLLCEKCSTSRTTFYKYYKNIEELCFEIENELLDSMERLYKEYNYHNIKDLNEDTVLPNLHEMYKYIYENKDTFLFLFSDNCPKTYKDRGIKFVMSKLQKAFVNYLDEKDAKEACAICTNFIMTTTKSLIMDEYSLTPKQLAILCRNLVLHLINNRDVYFS